MAKAYYKNKNERKVALDKIAIRRRQVVLYSRMQERKLLFNRRIQRIIKKRISTITRNINRNQKLKTKEQCEVCGSKNNLDIHHIKYTLNPSDWKVLCKKCHVKIHQNQ